MRDAAAITELAKRYVAFWKNSKNPNYWTGVPVSADEESFQDSVDELGEHPDDAWRFILEVLHLDRNGEVVDVLAAGQLEDLLSSHGPAFIERVETEARTDPRFATLLGGVWKSKMTDDVWTRVVAIWDRRGWDGMAVPKGHWFVSARAAADNPLWDFLSDRDLIQEFVDEGNAVHVTSDILAYAVSSGDRELLRLLLHLGGDALINVFEPDTHFTPLMVAVQGGNGSMIEFLLDAGADINAHDEGQIADSALTLAVERGDLETCRLLIARGADPTIPGFMGLTPFDIARKRTRMPELGILLASSEAARRRDVGR
jgi:hypothetical protein